MSALETVPESVEDAFEALEFRFLLHLPESELESADRLFFQIEQAHWYYEDFLADKHSHLRHFYKFKTFAQEMFNRCDTLDMVRPHFEELFTQFREYRARIPVYGAVLLNQDMTRVLLVQGYKGKSWGFPKGKVNEDEDEMACAVREVYEEIGYNCEGMTNRDDFVETSTKPGQGKYIKLFIVRGVDESFKFEPRVRKEIANIRFFNVSELPASQKQASAKFWALHTFTPQLLRWIQKQRNIDRRSRSNGKARNANSSAKKNAAQAPSHAKKDSPPSTAGPQQPPAGLAQVPKLFTVNVDAVMAAMRPFLY